MMSSAIGFYWPVLELADLCKTETLHHKALSHTILGSYNPTELIKAGDIQVKVYFILIQ